MKKLLHCTHLIEAHHYANLLLAAGIQAEVRNTFLSGALGDVPFLEAAPQVWIESEQDEKMAREVIAGARRPAQEPSWQCTGCGERLEGQFTECWRCGAVRAAEGDRP